MATAVCNCAQNKIAQKTVVRKSKTKYQIQVDDEWEEGKTHLISIFKMHFDRISLSACIVCVSLKQLVFQLV